MKQIFIIEDDLIMAGCISRAILQNSAYQTLIFTNAIEAIRATQDNVPDLICLDILLDGPDGFSLLNELNSYNDTVKIPIIIITSLEISLESLHGYNVRAVLQKEIMTPTMIYENVNGVLQYAE